MEANFKKTRVESEHTNENAKSLRESPQTHVETSVPTTNIVTIPVPIVQSEGTYTYVTIKGSLHDTSCAVFGLNSIEVQALSKRYRGGVKPVINGVMVSLPPVDMINVLAQLSYRVVTSCGEAEICWTLQREV